MLGKKAEPGLGEQGHQGKHAGLSPRTHGARAGAGGHYLGYSADRAGFAGKGTVVTSMQSREVALGAVCQSMAAEAKAIVGQTACFHMF